MFGTSMNINLIISSTYPLSAFSFPFILFRLQDPIPLWAINFKPLGKREINSSSINPVIATLWNVRYEATTLSKAPDLHSLMNSSLDRALGSMISAISAREDQSFWALSCELLVRGMWIAGLMSFGRRGNQGMGRNGTYWSISPRRRTWGLDMIPVERGFVLKRWCLGIWGGKCLWWGNLGVWRGSKGDKLLNGRRNLGRKRAYI